MHVRRGAPGFAFAPIQGRLYAVCYVERGQVRRIISFRKANKREERIYAKRPLTDKDGEVRPLTAEDAAHFRPIKEVDPGMIEAAARFRGRGRPIIGEAPKMHIGFRLAADVVNGIRATGKGYNARVEKVLREALAEGKL